jgi:hypothetical protein
LLMQRQASTSTETELAEKQKKADTINNVEWNVSCYCNSKLPHLLKLN